MQQAALRAVKLWDYRSAGTLEFLVDAEGDFFFLELNARLQVEHPVTELVTGLDLVAEQLRRRRGRPALAAPASPRRAATPSSAASTPRTRRATSARAPAACDDFRIAQGPGIRVDTHCEPGETVPPHYDSLLGKLCVWAADRPRAIARLRRALGETSVTRDPHHAAAAARHRPRRRPSWRAATPRPT